MCYIEGVKQEHLDDSVMRMMKTHYDDRISLVAALQPRSWAFLPKIRGFAPYLIDTTR